MLDHVINLARMHMKADTYGHDFFHAERTYKIAIRIANTELCDEEVLAPACYLHDIYRPLENEKGLNWHCSEEAIKKIGELLKNIHYPEEKLEPVLKAISLHETYEQENQNNIEGLILQDADRLDAMGAIGIARCFSFSSMFKLPMYTPSKMEQAYYDPAKLGKSAIHHFYDKLLKLKDNMNTEEGKRIAENRHKFMEQYLDEFFKEWNGNN